MVNGGRQSDLKCHSYLSFLGADGERASPGARNGVLFQDRGALNRPAAIPSVDRADKSLGRVRHHDPADQRVSRPAIASLFPVASSEI
jgi:hypothetical protein